MRGSCTVSYPLPFKEGAALQMRRVRKLIKGGESTDREVTLHAVEISAERFRVATYVNHPVKMPSQE